MCGRNRVGSDLQWGGCRSAKRLLTLDGWIVVCDHYAIIILSGLLDG